MHQMYLPMNLDYVYHLCLPLSLDSLPIKYRFLPMGADMGAEVMAF